MIPLSMNIWRKERLLVSKMSKRVNTDDMFKNMISPYNGTDEVIVREEVKENQSSSISSSSVSQKPVLDKQETEEKERVTVYLTKAQMKELRLQDAAKVKEADRSALIRAGLDIVLSISDETYVSLKQKAEVEGVSLGEIVKRIVDLFRKNVCQSL